MHEGTKAQEHTIRRATLKLDTGEYRSRLHRSTTTTYQRGRSRRHHTHDKGTGRRGSQQAGLQRSEAHVGGVGRKYIVRGATSHRAEHEGNAVVAVCTLMQFDTRGNTNTWNKLNLRALKRKLEQTRG